MSNLMPDDHQYMTKALRLASQGLFSSMPNPRVGCVIVKEGVIIGEGAHMKAGTPHAEVHALRQAEENARGATAYVTLEPCSHHGRTPPCAFALIEAGVRKVVIAMQDPNPLVAGKGIAMLKAAGIDVETGLMHKEAHDINPGFVKRMQNKTPFVRCKIASSLDGKTALDNGVSQWITGSAARLDVQHWRAQSCAILTGIGTIMKDNPSLNIREIDVDRQPISVIVDSDLRLPLDAKVLNNPNVLVAFAKDTMKKSQQLAAKGVGLICIPNAEGKVCLNALLSHLALNEVNEVMVEAGQELNGALLALNLIDEFLIYYAPKLMGNDAKGMFSLPSLQTMDQVVTLEMKDIRLFSNDIRILARRSIS